MKTAQEIFSKIHGTYEREYVDIVNNLAVLSLEVRLIHEFNISLHFTN